MNRFTGLMISALLLIAGSTTTHAQTERMFGMEGRLFGNSGEETGYSFGVSYGYQLNKFVSVALTLSYSKIKSESSCWEDRDRAYEADNDKDIINLKPSIMLMLPVLRTAGIYAEAEAMADVIPFDFVNINYTESSDNHHKTHRKSQTKFNHFAPGAFGSCGIYYKANAQDKPVYFFLGIGYGFHDPYKTWRNTILDNQDLSKYVPGDKKYWLASLKIRGTI